MKCEECEEGATEVCIECEEKLCGGCSGKLHSGGKRKYHSRCEICIRCQIVSNVFCNTCQANVCKICEFDHLTHQKVYRLKTIVYWDSAYLPESSQLQLSDYLARIQPNSIKIYSKSNKPALIMDNTCTVLHRPFYFSNIFMQDLEADIYFGLTDCYIVSELAPSQNMLSNYDQTMLNFYHLNPNTLSLRPLGCSFIIQDLYSNFLNGKVILTLHKFLKNLREKWGKNSNELRILVNRLQSCDKILVTTKEFNQYKLQQINLKIKELNPRVCLGILRSLKIDEIFPCEKAIQSRIREVLTKKVTNTEWTQLIKDMQTGTNFTFFSQEQSEPQFKFQQIKYEDEETFAIYPKGEEWASSDQAENIEYIKKTGEWKDLIDFLSNFFDSDKKNVTLNGGKYGCALLLKNFASESIKRLSIGKLSFMVQIVINEDIMRYQKTLLIWTKNQKPLCNHSIVSERIGIIRKEIAKLLNDKPDGMPLAQIPIVLKRRVKFQINFTELGFKKLKDLLLTFEEISLYPKNSKNPSAFLVLHHVELSTIAEFILLQIEKNAYCLGEKELSDKIYLEFGDISWTMYSSKDLREFIELYCKTLKIMKVGQVYIFIGRETEKEELSLSTLNSEYVQASNDEESFDLNIPEDLTVFCE